jgi:hypothetical protein
MLDKKQEEADRRQAAEMARWSPWTGMQPNQISRANLLGSTMQGGMAGAMMGDLGGPEAAPEGGAALTSDPAATASMTGGQSAATTAPGAYPGAATYNQQMAMKYPWLGMR